MTELNESSELDLYFQMESHQNSRLNEIALEHLFFFFFLFQNKKMSHSIQCYVFLIAAYCYIKGGKKLTSKPQTLIVSSI